MSLFTLAKHVIPPRTRPALRERLTYIAARLLSQRGISIHHDLRNILPAHEVRTVVDIGANRGERAARFMKEYPHAEVHCVEPVPELASLLRQRFRDTRCQVHEVAMTASSGQAQMTKQDTCGLFTLRESGKTHSEDNSSKRLTVVTQTLDDFCLHQQITTIDYLKIDAGGSDLEVLHGSRSLLDRSCVAVIEVEAGVNPDATIFSPLESMKAYLESHRYRVFAFYEQVAEWPTHQPQLRRVNCVFIAPRLQMAASSRALPLS